MKASHDDDENDEIGRWDGIPEESVSEAPVLSVKAPDKPVSDTGSTAPVPTPTKPRGVVPGADILLEKLTDGSGDSTGIPTPIFSESETCCKNNGCIYCLTLCNFGLGVLIDGEYMMDNIIDSYDELYPIVEQTYYTAVENQTKIVLRIFRGIGRKKIIRPNMDAMGNEQESDPADQVQYIGILEMNLPANTAKGTPISVTMQLGNPGVGILAINRITGESVKQIIRFEQNIDDNTECLESL